MASNRTRFATASLAALIGALTSTTALAGTSPPDNLPAPGILILVAAGVIGAIAIARKLR